MQNSGNQITSTLAEPVYVRGDGQGGCRLTVYDFFNDWPLVTGSTPNAGGLLPLSSLSITANSELLIRVGGVDCPAYHYVFNTEALDMLQPYVEATWPLIEVLADSSLALVTQLPCYERSPPPPPAPPPPPPSASPSPPVATVVYIAEWTQAYDVPASGGALSATSVQAYVDNLVATHSLNAAQINWHVERITVASVAMVVLPTGASAAVASKTREAQGTCPAPGRRLQAAELPDEWQRRHRRLSEAAYQATYQLCKRAENPNDASFEIDVLTVRYAADAAARTATAAVVADEPGSTPETAARACPAQARPPWWRRPRASRRSCVAAAGGIAAAAAAERAPTRRRRRRPQARRRRHGGVAIAVPALPPLAAQPPIPTTAKTAALWIIVGATVGVLALAGIVVGSLVTAGVFRKPADEKRPAPAGRAKAGRQPASERSRGGGGGGAPPQARGGWRGRRVVWRARRRGTALRAAARSNVGRVVEL